MSKLFHVAVNSSDRYDSHAAKTTREAIGMGNWEDGTKVVLYFCFAEDAGQARLPNWYLFDSKSMNVTIKNKTRRGYVVTP